MDTKQISKILFQMRTDSIHCPHDEASWKAMMHEYDVVFLGEKFNIINSLEFCHCLKEKYDIDISNEDLNTILPGICKSLNMHYEPMKKLTDLTNSSPYCYQIYLW